MPTLPASLLHQIFVVATLLPKQTTQIVIDSLQHEIALSDLLLELPNPLWRHTISTLFEIWKRDAPRLHSQSLSVAIETAQYSLEKSNESLAAEIVWTGPNVSKIPVRQTEQVLLQIIEEAKTELIIVSFAIYKVPGLSKALLKAIHRGVSVTIIAETSEHQKNVPFGVEQGLGQELATNADIYEWPRDIRPKDEKGRSGSLHMKVAIADQKHLFVTSANLTAYALSLNMELGLLLHSQNFAHTVADHLKQLIQAQVFHPLD